MFGTGVYIKVSCINTSSDEGVNVAFRLLGRKTDSLDGRVTEIRLLDAHSVVRKVRVCQYSVVAGCNGGKVRYYQLWLYQVMVVQILL